MTLESLEVEKDLGICISSNLKLNRQCTAAASKAMVVLRNVIATFGTLTKDNFHIVYRIYIRGHLEYVVQTWALKKI